MVTNSNRNFTHRIQDILPFSRCSRFSYRKHDPESPAEENVLNGSYKKSHFFTMSNLGGISYLFETNFDRTKQIHSISHPPSRHFEVKSGSETLYTYRRPRVSNQKTGKISGINMGSNPGVPFFRNCFTSRNS
jgi:hypothetical protein